MTRTHVVGIGVVDWIAEHGGHYGVRNHFPLLVGVGTEIGVKTDVAEAHHILVEGGLDVVGIALQQIGIAGAERIVVIDAEACVVEQVVAVRKTARVAEAVAFKCLGLIAQVYARHQAGERGVDAHLVSHALVLNIATHKHVFETQAQFGSEAAPTLLAGDVSRRRCIFTLGFVGAVRQVDIVLIQTLVVVVAPEANLGTGLNLEVVIQRQGVVHLRAALWGIRRTRFVTADVGQRGVTVVALFVRVAAVAPIVAVEAGT